MRFIHGFCTISENIRIAFLLPTLSEIRPHHIPLRTENSLILTLHMGKLRYSLLGGLMFQKGASNSSSKHGFAQDCKEAQHF